jgi:hypothetical protein
MDPDQSNPEQPGALGGAVGNEGVILQDGETESHDSEEPETKITRCRIEKSALPAVVSAAEYAGRLHYFDSVPVILSESEVLALLSRPPELAPVSADATERHRHDTCDEQEEEKLCEHKQAQYDNRMQKLKKLGFVFQGLLDATLFLKRAGAG